METSCFWLYSTAGLFPHLETSLSGKCFRFWRLIARLQRLYTLLVCLYGNFPCYDTVESWSFLPTFRKNMAAPLHVMWSLKPLRNCSTYCPDCTVAQQTTKLSVHYPEIQIFYVVYTLRCIYLAVSEINTRQRDLQSVWFQVCVFVIARFLFERSPQKDRGSCLGRWNLSEAFAFVGCCAVYADSCLPT